MALCGLRDVKQVSADILDVRPTPHLSDCAE
jgi:hypothetical protein